MNLSIKYKITPFISAFLISLLFISGSFSFERIGWYDFNVSYLFLILAILWTVLTGFSNKHFYLPRRLLAQFLFIISLLFIIISTSLWSIDINYAIIKTIDLSLIIIYLIIAFILMRRHPDSIYYISFIFLVISLIYSISSILTLIIFNASRGELVITGPNVVTRIIFFGIMASLFLHRHINKTFLSLVIVLNLAGIVAIGSRGGMVAALATILLLTIMYLVPNMMTAFKVRSMNNRFKTNLFKVGFLFKIILLGTIIYFLWDFIAPVFNYRIVDLLINNLHYAGRDFLYMDFLEIFFDNPIFGVGLGGHAYFGWDYYPHNIFIEFMADGGLYLLVFALIYFFIYFYHSITQIREGKYFIVTSFYVILVQQFSGGYFDFRYFFLFALMAVMLQSNKNSIYIFNSTILDKIDYKRQVPQGLVA
jgi:hypothetical protein